MRIHERRFCRSLQLKVTANPRALMLFSGNGDGQPYQAHGVACNFFFLDGHSASLDSDEAADGKYYPDVANNRASATTNISFSDGKKVVPPSE